MAGSEGDDGAPRNYVCYVCQQPVPRDESVRWRGEPVHSECVEPADEDSS